MRWYSLIRSGKAVAMLCGAVLLAGIVTSPARADEWDKRTILTVKNQPIQIRETVLQPGEYVLRLLDSPSERHVVQIFNRDQTHIINTVLALPAERLQPTGRTQFTFWETPPGTAKAMRTWFYPGDNFGQEFPYPKHLQQIAMAEPAPAPSAPVAPQAAAPRPPEPTPEPASEAQQPVEIAQNAPPATPAAPAHEQPMQLPKTGSPYPLVGLSGAALLGLFGLLRLMRTA